MSITKTVNITAVCFKFKLGDTGFYLVTNKKKRIVLECVVLERHYQDSQGINGEDFKIKITYEVGVKLPSEPKQEYFKSILPIPEPLLFSNAQDCLNQ